MADLQKKEVERKARKFPPVSVRMEQLLKGEILIEELDDEEILRGQLRSADGSFSGNRVGKVPNKLMVAFQRELVRRMTEHFQQDAFNAIEVIGQIMRYGETRDMVRLDAAKYTVERIMGKIEQKTVVEGEVTVWQQALESGELIIDVEHPTEVVDVEVVNDVEEAGRRPVRRRSQRGS